MATTATTSAEILALLTANPLEVYFGAELLDESDLVIEDISADLVRAGCEVEHHNDAEVAGTCKLSLSRELEWGTARVRLYQVFTGAGYTARFDLGIYVLTTVPDTEYGVTPITFDVDGYDKLYLLQRVIGDTYVVPTATHYLAAVATLITASGYTGAAPQFDGTLQDSALTAPLAWVLEPSSPPRYIDVANDTLKAIVYNPLWTDRAGRFRSEPYQAPADATPVWTFDTGDARTNLVGVTRKRRIDQFSQTNFWRFTMAGTAALPVEGINQYTYVIPGTVIEHRDIRVLDVADYAALEAEGKRIIAAAAQRVETIEITTAPFPLLWHLDVVNFIDLEMGGLKKCQVIWWRMPGDGGDLTVVMEVIV